MRNKLYYKNRIAKLKAKGEVQNRALIAKAQRKLRQLEKDEQNFDKLIESVSASAIAISKANSALIQFAEAMDSFANSFTQKFVNAEDLILHNF